MLPEPGAATQQALGKKAEKMEQAIAYLLDTHRRQDADQNEDALVLRKL